MSRLNPYENPGPWGFVDIGGVRIPGVVVTIDGHDKPEKWNVQEGTKSSNATTVWKGTKVADGIKIVTKLPNRDAFDRWYDVRDKLAPKLGTKPPTLPIRNAAINFSGITRVSRVNVGAPRWVEAGGYWTGELIVTEVNEPKPTNTGVADRGHGAVSGEIGPADPNADLKAKVDALLEKANSL